jgi:thymidylate synthase (FAD)
MDDKDVLGNALRVNINVTPETQTVNVLDKGYVRLIDYMGSDLSVVNAARASFAKESLMFNQADARLLHFLAKEGHLSPFRHAFVTLEIKAPLMVARQHWKYVVGSDHTMDGWNEASRRYVTADEEFYVIEAGQWRAMPENKKQGSGDPIEKFTGAFYSQAFEKWSKEGLSLYHSAMRDGICAEQARIFLPAYSLYINYRWSTSLQSVIHFLNQRLAEDAQKEIQDYAKAVHILTQPLFPVSMNAFGL